MKLLSILILIAASLMAQTPAKGTETVEPKASVESSKTAPPIVPDAIQRDYFRELATYQGIRAQHEEALKVAEHNSNAMTEQGKKVDAAGEAMRAACGGDYVLNQKELVRGVVECVEKPKPTPAVQPVPGPAAAKPAAQKSTAPPR